MKPSNKEILIYALREGVTERYEEEIISFHCKTDADIARVKAAASAEGWHSFRVAYFSPGEKPDFTRALA